LSEVVASAAVGEALDEFPALQCLGERSSKCEAIIIATEKHLQDKTPPKRGSAKLIDEASVVSARFGRYWRRNLFRWYILVDGRNRG
jgi:hypothetical protein